MGKYCPKCGAGLTQGIKFCAECGAKIGEKPPTPGEQVPPEQVPQQQYVQQQSQMPSPPPPKIDTTSGLFHQSPLAKLGLVIIILAVIGLILSYLVPWIYVISSLGSTSVGHESFSGDFFEYVNVMMVDIGLIFLLALGVIAMILGIAGAKQKISNPLFSLAAAIIAAIAFIPGLWIIIMGIRFVGLNIIAFHSNLLSLSFYPAPYIMLIFGIIFLIIASKIIRRESAALNDRALNQPQQSQAPQVGGGGIQ